jgi:ApaG protein
VQQRPFYYKLSAGIRISVRPSYLVEHSLPQLERYAFSYHVRIENIQRRTVRLLSRRWLINDSIGEQLEVAGDGVVGRQPLLGAGGVYEYQSSCILRSPRGWMEGEYVFSDEAGERFSAQIPRFDLIMPQQQDDMTY